MTNPVYEKLMNCYASVKDRLPSGPRQPLFWGPAWEIMRTRPRWKA